MTDLTRDTFNAPSPILAAAEKARAYTKIHGVEFGILLNPHSFSPFGEVIGTNKQVDFGTKFSDKEILGKVVVHSHPNDSSLSFEDATVARSLENEVYAAGTDGSLFKTTGINQAENMSAARILTHRKAHADKISANLIFALANERPDIYHLTARNAAYVGPNPLDRVMSHAYNLLNLKLAVLKSYDYNLSNLFKADWSTFLTTATGQRWLNNYDELVAKLNQDGDPLDAINSLPEGIDAYQL